ncbi:Uncharacterized protein OBRU01_04558 [Operophtera brumata]|uniref:Uncharacterized protein n=1 Tax=Operophtera brumata TaxID=104452 RepID=A0A0L7LFW4_OPEBR|nr:Uncharacterized protein OBRU01_04558 [Operophtera brumata]
MSSLKGASSSSTHSKLPRTGKTSKVVPPRKVVPSKKLPFNSSYESKICSTGAICTNKKLEKPKKVTKSDLIKKHTNNASIDFCKKCGESSCNGEAKSSQNVVESDVETLVSINNKHDKVKTNGKTLNSVQQYYKNENFKPSTESLGYTNGNKKLSLDTIKEVPEVRSHDSLFRVFDDDELENLDSKDNLNEIKEFRQKNYFECHSADSRIKSKGSVTSLQDHKCVYRFYLNDRLFPVPLCTDHTKEIRCIECLLPMKTQAGSNDKINGTIQAKVTLGKKNQDVMILLPVQEPLIIHEKRIENKKDEETLFFGLINLDKMGHSVFNPTLPGNSFALKYQKGFQEFKSKDEYSYNDVDKDNVIVI